MNQKDLIRVVKRLQRQARLRQPKRPDFYFNQKGKLGKGVVPKYQGTSIAATMKKLFGTGTNT